ncbi:hypothetical protein FD723_10480 [Nostoc sp. C052]|uniref:Cas10/Cmr2 second palm domain-containing protein n=1 Tax=Nostoc sp. C052 TaxID=2576902 RepID=UPI0015C40A7A|nr:hypothetical protein [Nostoc sp. C052]QLE40845.1 hypothetical protein FD723_10480 [Nostoc sp. C052]
MHSQIPGQEMRFQRLPVVDECATSGLPAAKVEPDVEQNLVLRSTVSRSKRRTASTAFQRIQELLIRNQVNVNFARSLRVLDKEFQDISSDTVDNYTHRPIDWLAVVHADGNGLGEIILKFDEHLKKLNRSTNRDYINYLRAFSIALDICTERAFVKALTTFEDFTNNNSKNHSEATASQLIPVIPLVLGGDDLTVVCAGKYAIKFTQSFLREFEIQTAQAIDDLGEYKNIITEIAGEALGVKRLSACAGIAIIKAHFPFYLAYELSADLMTSAKEVKKKLQHPQKDTPFPCSALDFHVLYDSSGVDLKQIRQKLQLNKNQTRLYGRPLIVTPQKQLTNATSTGVQWADKHRWEEFEMRVRSLHQTDKLEKKPLLPNSQMHDIRSSLFFGKDGADAQLKLIWERYKSLGLCNLVADIQQPSLFWQEQAEAEQPINVTGFLDAMDAADFFLGKIWED